MKALTRFLGTDLFRFLVLLGSFALTWYVYTLLRTEQTLPSMLLWFLGGVIGHDAVLLPVYALGDRTLVGVLAPLRRHVERVPVSVNHVRLPALGSGLLFLVFFPGILQQGAQDYAKATGQNQAPYMDNWLFVTCVLFGLSFAVWLVRTVVALLRRDGGGAPAPGE